jgi:MYXO-CTERM domain-containing protein
MTCSRAFLGFSCALALTFGSVGVASAQRILVYGPGGTTATASFPVGATVTVASAAMWATLTRANFATYDAIWIDSGSCSIDPTIFDVARANRAAWTRAVEGRVVVSGADLDFHNTASAQQLMRQMAAWIGGLGATAEGGSTGLYLSFGCTMYNAPPATPVDVLDAFGAFAVTGMSGEPSVIDAHPITAGLTAGVLAMGQFGHQVIPAFPSGWQSVIRMGSENFVVVRDSCPSLTVPSGGFSVAEASSISLMATSTGAVEWDLNNDGTFETTGNPVSFSAAALDGPSTRAIALRGVGRCSSVSTTSSISVVNLNPMVTSTPPVTVTAGATLTYPITTTDPAGALDPRTFVRTTGPAGSIVGASSGVLTWTPGFAVAGTTVPFVITVSDGDGGTATHSFSVSVSCPDADSDGVPDGRCPGESDCNDGNATIFPGATELCDTVDQDCDGAVANGFLLGTACTAGVGTCMASGVLVCNSTTATRCNAVPTASAAERCGSLADEDCDGTTDEGFDVGDACSVGVGVCVASGAKICTADALGTECDAVEGAAGTESCNGLDDDCNGTLDDGGDALCAGSGDGTMCVAVGPLAACGCAADADCGDATSGRICDLDTVSCADGCGVGTDRNGCPADQFCTSMDPAVDGLCTTSCNFDVDCAASPEVPFCFVDGSGGFCVECTTDTHCEDRSDGRDRCVGPDHTCAACSATDTTACSAAGAGSACVSGLCGCASDADCASDRMCDAASDACVDRPTPDGGMPDAGMSDAGGADAGGGSADVGAGADAGTGGPAGGGCGCSAPGGGNRSGLAGLGLLALGLVMARRRSKR